MRAVVWHGRRRISVDEVPDPSIREPTDAVIRVTASGICGSDLHLFGGFLPIGMRDGDILGHEAVGVVEQTGKRVDHIAPGDRVIVPFNISCGECFLCRRGLQSQCETTQNRRDRRGGSLFGYTHLYGGVPGAQAERLRVPMAHFGPIPAPDSVDDATLVLLADVLPTAWQAVRYGEASEGDTVAVWGLGPIGQLCARIARHLGAARVIGVDTVAERQVVAERHGVEAVDGRIGPAAREEIVRMTDGRGVDVGIDAVGMEAMGSAADRLLQTMRLQIDRLNALRDCAGSIRRGGVLSITGVYAGVVPMFPIGSLFDRQITIRMGQANVRRWTDELVPLVADPADPLGLKDVVTHVLPLDHAPEAYRMFRDKRDGVMKVVLTPEDGR